MTLFHRAGGEAGRAQAFVWVSRRRWPHANRRSTDIAGRSYAIGQTFGLSWRAQEQPSPRLGRRFRAASPAAASWLPVPGGLVDLLAAFVSGAAGSGSEPCTVLGYDNCRPTQNSSQLPRDRPSRALSSAGEQSHPV